MPFFVIKGTFHIEGIPLTETPSDSGPTIRSTGRMDIRRRTGA